MKWKPTPCSQQPFRAVKLNRIVFADGYKIKWFWFKSTTRIQIKSNYFFFFFAVRFHGSNFATVILNEKTILNFFPSSQQYSLWLQRRSPSAPRARVRGSAAATVAHWCWHAACSSQAAEAVRRDAEWPAPRVAPPATRAEEKGSAAVDRKQQAAPGGGEQAPGIHARRQGVADWWLRSPSSGWRRPGLVVSFGCWAIEDARETVHGLSAWYVLEKSNEQSFLPIYRCTQVNVCAQNP